MTRRSALEDRPTQAARIVNLLRSRAGEWVPLPEILDLHISQYSARIFQARHEWGLRIENRVETINGQKHSWFRLIEDAAPRHLPPAQIPSLPIDRPKGPAKAQAELFSRNELERTMRWEDVG